MPGLQVLSYSNASNRRGEEPTVFRMRSMQRYVTNEALFESGCVSPSVRRFNLVGSSVGLVSYKWQLKAHVNDSVSVQIYSIRNATS